MINSIQVLTYHDILRSIKRGSYKGIFINAKPLLIMAVIDAIDRSLLSDNKILFDKSLEDIYKETCLRYDFPVTPFFKPFYYLSYDEFWHLKWKTVAYNEQHPSPKFLRENIEYASLDNILWDLLQDQETRDYFRKSIEDYYLK